MVNIEWANKYTDYLQGKIDHMDTIDNNQLKIHHDYPEYGLLEDEDYVIIFNMVE